ncbi:hypothetical protein GCM10027347_39210 [Larkinella harenae]
MSKSDKKKTAPVSAKPKSSIAPAAEMKEPSAHSSATSTLTERPPQPGGIELIRFDTRLKWFLGMCLSLFILFTLAKIHPISLPMWNQLLPDGSDAKRGLISGTPRAIRMDDYAVGTPWVLSQANRGFPVENETIGGEKAPILLLPTRHFSALFRPDHWGFFFLSLDHAYAWIYAFRGMFALVGATLMLLLLTRNNFWLSVFGSLWLFLSSGTQSWTYIPTMMIGCVSFLFVAAIYLVYSTRKIHILGSSLALAWLAFVYALLLYPPYQIPLSYAVAALLAGYMLNNFLPQNMLVQWPVKTVGAVLAVAVLAVSGLAFYADAKPTLDAVMNTVYPGRRSESGGTGFIANWFSEYFSWLYTDTKFPKNWLNHCELSHYVSFAPIVIPAAGLSFALTRKIDWVVMLLSLFVIWGYIWIEIGFPEWLAKGTLWSMSPTRRTQIPFGIANVLLTIAYLYFLTTRPWPSRSSLYTVLGGVAVLVFMIYAAYVNINDSDGFFKGHQMIVPVVFMTGLGLLLLPTWQIPYRTALFSVGMILFLLPNFRLNPVSKGLGPITDHTLYKTVQNLHQQEPKARWVIFGSQYLSYLVTATGVDLLSGVKYTPARQLLKVLDPQMKRDSAYNRYAHTVYSTYIDGRTDTVVIQNTFEDGYQVAMDPCSPRFKQMNVKYIIFDRQPQPVEVRCMKQVSTLGSISIYRIND